MDVGPRQNPAYKVKKSLMTISFVILLSVHGLIGGMAQDHAEELARAGELYHQDISSLFASRGGPCEWAGEVIYKGGNPDDRWDAYAASPSHSQVVNEPRTHHGVGVVEVEGIYIVVDIFCRVADTTTTTTTSSSAPTTSPPPTPPPITTTTTTTAGAPDEKVSPPQTRPPLCPVLGQICVY